MDSEGKQSRLLGVANISLEGVDVLARSRKVDFLRNVKAVTSSAVPNAADQDSKSVRVGCCNVRVHLTSEDEPATTPVEDGTFPCVVVLPSVGSTNILSDHRQDTCLRISSSKSYCNR